MDRWINRQTDKYRYIIAEPHLKKPRPPSVAITLTKTLGYGRNGHHYGTKVAWKYTASLATPIISPGGEISVDCPEASLNFSRGRAWGRGCRDDQAHTFLAKGTSFPMCRGDERGLLFIFWGGRLMFEKSDVTQLLQCLLYLLELVLKCICIRFV